jgi:serine/threonine protein kinase
MFGFAKKDGYLCLVTEFVTGGDLTRYIKDNSLYIDTQLKVNLLLTTVRGMLFLHSKNVIHRDLKPGNILVEDFDAGKVKVCDFGLSSMTKRSASSKKGEAEGSATDAFGSPAYAAPELPQPTHTNKVDVFSFAVITWEVMTRQALWPDAQKGYEIQQRVLSGERMKLVPGCPLNPLISRCWQPVPEARPEFVEIHEAVESVLDQITKGQVVWNNPTEPGSPASQLNSPTQQQMNSPRGPRPVYGGAQAVGGVAMPGYQIGSNQQQQPATPPPRRNSNSNSNSSTGIGIHPTSTIGVSGPGTHACEQATLRAFGHRASLSWKEFSDALLQAYRCDDVAEVAGQQFSPDVERLRYILEKPHGSNQVDRSLWLEFSRWFAPLLVPGDTTGDTQDGRPSIKQISSLVGHSWFFGFLSAPEARDQLQRENAGTYLFRFSSSPGCYALSVNYGQVGHWRITTERRVVPGSNQQTIVYKIDTREYSSLLHIIESHQSSGGVPLEIKQTGYTATYLHLPHQRREPLVTAQGDDAIYGEYV